MDNTCDILITNALTVIPLQGIVDTNILIEDGKIKALRKSLNNIQSSRVINASHKYVLPGIIDPHVHYGVFTGLERSAITESRSAAVGGISTIIRMLRMNGSCKNILKQLDSSRRTHLVDYRLHVSVLNSLQMHEMPYLARLGINSFKIYMNLGSDVNRILADLDPSSCEMDEIEVNMTDKLTSEIVKKVAYLKSLLLVHAEDHVECSNVMKKMILPNSTKDKNMLEMWSKARPTSSEASSISKITKMASETGTNLYFAHIGSSKALENIVKSRDIYQNINIWAETCPHYLTHTFEYNSLKGKVVPPIRSKLDVAVMWNAIEQGLIDTIGSDHVASTLKMKVVNGDLWKTLSGFPGLATLLPVMLSEGVNRKRISLERLSEICSYNPARIFKMYPKKGTIQCKSDADLTIIDINKEKVVTPEDLQSSADYTIYEGWKLRGWPIMTIIRGKPVMENGDVDLQATGHGRFVTAVDCDLK